MSYLLNRFIQIVIVLFILSFIVFQLIDLMPGDPITRLHAENPGLKPDDIKRLIKQRGLDKPSHIRYFYWLKQLSQGELGYSMTYKIRVEEMVGTKIFTTLKLMIPVFFISLLFAIPIGIYSAIRQYSRFDYTVNLMAFIGLSVPTFVVGLVVILIFAQKLNLFPPGGIKTPGVSELLDQIKYIILPVAVLSYHTIGTWLRYLRGSLLEVLKQDYIRTARAKGMSEDVVILKHAVRNALIPFITILALSIPALFSGALITETIFGIHGMGRLLYQSIVNQDTDVAMAAFLFLSFLTLCFNYFADMIYMAIDPRIRLK